MYSNKNVIKCITKNFGNVEYKPLTIFTEDKIVFYTLEGTKLAHCSVPITDIEDWEEVLPENYIQYSDFTKDRYNLKCKLINLCCLIIELYVPGGDNIPGLTEYDLVLDFNNSTLQILVNDTLKASLQNISGVLPTKSHEVWSFASHIKSLYQNQLALAVNNPAKDNYKKALEELEI